ncbi:tyrosine phosphatase family-domain-containing protein [Clohesyomyces aquaticus]|uniref:Tyrosine phosphatase family-domain-containing protein n=1 Tax=Clohesyomyces aquaticus TaxID=1231657 RepID=A0A1Y2A4I9_9PLEO|nr:tyrosine phosphatase family-domain-containing protein [Clohesyomyces aquaticus]
MASPFTTPSPVPLPSPPFHSIPNLSNLRDCALLPPSGLPITSTTKVRPGILFRSAEVSRLTAQDWDAVKRVGVGRVFDLRSAPEVEKAWNAVAEEGGKEEGGDGGKEMNRMMERVMGDVKREWVPVFEESDYSPERLAERYLKYMGEGTDGFVQAYHDILLHAGSSFRTILLYLSNIPPPSSSPSSSSSLSSASPPHGALIHCTAGKDRTGIFIAILLSYLGVSPTLIATEYNLTETGLAHVRDAIVERLMQSPGFKAYTQSLIQGRNISRDEIAAVLGKKDGEGKVEGDGKKEVGEQEKKAVEMGRQAALRMVGARKEVMIAALGMVEKEWGSAEGYLRKVCGLGDKELEGLRRALVLSQG